MNVGYHLGYWAGGIPAGAREAVAMCDTKAFESVWTSESYGSDCLTPLAWWGAETSRITLGTNIMQIAARTPTAAAMAALSLGVSGPQVVEGWYGQPYPRPLRRMREYVDVVRALLRRDAPVRHEGEFYPLPLPGGAGLGRALTSNVCSLLPNLPIMIAAGGPRNIALVAEIGDGCLPMFFSPRIQPYYSAALNDGFGARRGSVPELLGDFGIAGFVPFVVNDDLDAAADQVRPYLALYISGMGARTAIFHADCFIRLGYEDEVARIQAAYLAGRQTDAAAVVTNDTVQDIAIIGSPARIRDELQKWSDSMLTTLIVQCGPSALPTVVNAISAAA